MGRTTFGAFPISVLLRVELCHYYYRFWLVARERFQGDLRYKLQLNGAGITFSDAKTTRLTQLPGNELYVSSLDRESIANQCMDINKNSWISKWIFIKARIIGLMSITHGYSWIFIVYVY